MTLTWARRSFKSLCKLTIRDSIYETPKAWNRGEPLRDAYRSTTGTAAPCTRPASKIPERLVRGLEGVGHHGGPHRDAWREARELRRSHWLCSHVGTASARCTRLRALVSVATITRRASPTTRPSAREHLPNGGWTSRTHPSFSQAPRLRSRIRARTMVNAASSATARSAAVWSSSATPRVAGPPHLQHEEGQ